MAENVGDDKSDFESVTSSQKSFLKNCPFYDPGARPTKSTDSENTEVIGNLVSPAVVQTPILSFSSSTSLDSINDDVFRTPPENASLSSAAESEPRVRVLEFKLRQEASKLKSPSSTPKTTPVSENVRVSEIKPRAGASKLKSLSSTPKTTPVLEIKPLGEASELKSPSLTPKRTPVLQNVRVSKTKRRGEASKLKSPSSTPNMIPVLENVRVFEIKPRRGASKLKSPFPMPKTTPVSEIKRQGGASKLKSPSSTPKTTPVLENGRALETNHSSDSGVLMLPLSSPPSVRVPGKHPDYDSSPPTEIERAMVVDKQPVSASVADTEVTKCPDKVIKITKVDSDEDVLPFREIIEALLRNSGKNLYEKDDSVSYVEILKKCGLRFL